MNPRLAAAVAAGKLTGTASRVLGRGGGTALPGLVAERLAPSLVAHLGRQLGRGALTVTATNGKTTTTRIVASIAAAAAVPVLHNREGSNMMRGLASALLERSSATGRVHTGTDLLGLFEVDEATLPAATAALAPRVLVFINCFRDQLDRYGEVDTVTALWREALAVAPRDATLVLNADDPSVAELADGWDGPVHFFGVDDAAMVSTVSGAFDARWCRRCGGSFAYDRQYFAHVGLWRCTACDAARPPASTTARNIQLHLDQTSFAVDGLGELTMPLAGLYNVYNALAAIAAARVLEFAPEAIGTGLASVEAAFGRQEVVELEGRRLRLMLVKNPAGANEVLSLLVAVRDELGGRLNVAALLNDRFADGQDVSWIWDVDYERVAALIARTWAGGDRADDLALRLKYAGWPGAAVRTRPGALLDHILAGTRPGDQVFVIPTYTAMLDLRAELARRGAVSNFWKR